MSTRNASFADALTVVTGVAHLGPLDYGTLQRTAEHRSETGTTPSQSRSSPALTGKNLSGPRATRCAGPDSVKTTGSAARAATILPLLPALSKYSGAPLSLQSYSCQFTTRAASRVRASAPHTALFGRDRPLC